LKRCVTGARSFSREMIDGPERRGVGAVIADVANR
jgi:hypothetical protein